ncbi:uncharacterized protein CPUR_02492 [Claviceps purpurea 20.1]|uniref:Something about silencing protein 4 domain-containing protein n=1 Tax=Claviceps purpurea (strain 20.1) TaxID=1111077 RepID=M1W7X9_CLAP2|nr:uncharacterized protein CPUR_02492 [Claviceps purpurea 20.1]
MASVTRSNRRAEGLHHAHHARHARHAHHHLHAHSNNLSPLTRTAKHTAGLYPSHDGAGDGPHKRTLEPADRDIDVSKPKKTRIAVEIVARQQQLPVRPPTIVPVHDLSMPNLDAATKFASRSTIATPHTLPPILSPPIAATGVASHHHYNHHRYHHHHHPYASPTSPSPYDVSNQIDEEPHRTRYQHKAVNGTRTKLDRLQAKPAAAPEQGRKLRSQEATRFKSDLSAYFPDYDEVIGNDPKEQHLLNVDTPIVVLDSNAQCLTPETQRVAARGQQHNHVALDIPIRAYGDVLFTDVFDSQKIDFGFLEAQQNGKILDDPLPDSLFKPSHKRAERLERSIRNAEKGRAQHEKDQIVRLLEGLQGPDWLRIMGVSGVTETKKRTFEPARLHFIQGCQGILEKFRAWSLEEKRRKLEKEKAIHAEQQAALEQQQKDEQRRQPRRVIKDSEDDEGSDNDNLRGPDDSDNSDEDIADEIDPHIVKGESDQAQMDVIEDSEEVVTSQSDTSDASPAKQLRQEALARSNLAAANAKRSRGLPRPIALPSAEPPKEFTSFFSKKYERDSALNRPRRAGRKILAWGHAIPHMDQADFVLPEEFRDEEQLKLRARKKRRDKRNGRP